MDELLINSKWYDQIRYEGLYFDYYPKEEELLGKLNNTNNANSEKAINTPVKSQLTLF